MAKFEEVYEDTLKLIQKHIDSSFIPREIKIKILNNESIKGFGKVSKSSDLVKYMTEFDILIQINESIFDQLTVIQKEYLIKDLLAQISYDADKDKINIITHDITTFSGVLRNYDIDTYLSVSESIKTLLEQKEIEKENEKNAKTKKNGKH
jgi:hypothetical protein